MTALACRGYTNRLNRGAAGGSGTRAGGGWREPVQPLPGGAGGGAAEGAMDANNMLKPMLGRGELHLTIPPRTNANQTFRLRGKGMPHLRDPNKRGDMFARVRLVLPGSLTDQEVNAIHSPPSKFFYAMPQRISLLSASYIAISKKAILTRGWMQKSPKFRIMIGKVV